MILLLDAHAVLWALLEPEKLHSDARTALESPANDVVVSAVTIWELEIKRALGKLRFDAELVPELERTAMDVIPITAADATSAARLPLLHRDPFDRMIVAQALRLEAVLVSRDTALMDYGVELLPA